MCAVLEQCDLFIGNDSGPAHLAAAMNCPTVVVSRHPRNGALDHSNSPARFAPRGGRVMVLQPASGMDDCTECCREAEAHCILQVTVDEVLAVSMKLLQEPRREAGRAPDHISASATSRSVREA